MKVSRSDLICVFVRIVVYGLKLIGLAPFSFGKSSTSNNTLTRRILLFQHSKLGAVYNFLLLVPILFIESNKILAVLSQNGSSMFETITKIVYVLREFMRSATSFLCLIFWSLRQRKAASILNLLCESSDRLSSLKQQPTKNRTVVLIIIHFTIHIVLWVMVAIKAINYTSFRSFATSCLNVSPVFVVFYYYVQYLGIVEFVTMKLRTINQCLTNYHELNYLSPSSVENSHLTIANLLTRYKEQIASIQLLRNVRATLIELGGDIADFFSLPILFCVVFSFVAFFYDIYEVMVGRERTRYLPKTISNIEWMVMLTLAHVYPVTSLSLNVTRAKKEARLTGKIVNKLLATVRKGSEVRSELKQFSRELLHDNDDVFTAYGLFSLDSTLLPSILASTVTYFVILIQLRPPICDHKPSCNCSN